MTANADYGVSIVESFAPPKNWLPGETVNKDVYAVNTGSIDAFVKENVEGVLNYTYEEIVTAFDADNVKLTVAQVEAIQGTPATESTPASADTEDGINTYEAGGYLAWTNAKIDVVMEDYFTVDGTEVKEGEGGNIITLAADKVLHDPENVSEASYDKTFTKSYTVGETTYYLESVTDGAKLYTEGTGNTFVDSGKTIAKAQREASSSVYPTGPVNSARIDDSVAGRWIPPTEGVYIFRRSIDTKANDTSIFDDTINADSANRANFTYAGYYYKPGTNPDHSDDKYYEIVIGDDTHPLSNGDGTVTDKAAPFADWRFDTSATSAQVGKRIDVNGVILEEPTVRFVKEVEVKNADATFLYNGGDASNPATLTVSYTPGQADTTRVTETKAAYDAALAAENSFKAEALGYSVAAAQAERDYEDAVGDYNTKKSRYDQTKADYDYANDLVTATNKLYRAADARAIFQKKLNDAKDARDNAWNNPTTAAADSVVEKATELTDTATTKPYYLVQDVGNGDNANISFNKIFGNTNKDATPATGTGANLVERINYLYNNIANADGQTKQRFTRLKNNMDQMNALWAEIDVLWNGKAAVDTVYEDGWSAGEEGADQHIVTEGSPAVIGIKTDLATLKGTTPISSSDAETIRNRLATNLEQFKEKFNQYKQLYANIKYDADNGSDLAELSLTDLVDANNSVVSNTADQAINMYDVGFKQTTSPKGLEALINDYISAENTYQEMADETHPAKEGTLGKADADWSAAVTQYNNDVKDTADTSAYAKYSTSVSKKQPELNDFDRLSNAAVNNRTLTDQHKLVINEADESVKKYVPAGADVDNYAKIAPNTAYTAYVTADDVEVVSDEYKVKAAKLKNATIAVENDFTQIGITADKHEKVNEDTTIGGTAANPKALTIQQLSSAVTTAGEKIDGQGEGDLKTAYDTAAAKDRGAEAEIRRLEGITSRAYEAWDEAVKGGSPVNIIINLAANEDNLEWQYDTTNIGTHEEGKPGTEANFYYKHVLKAGDTSAKLIDSVYLDKNTKPKAYKTLVFDLNVGLDSIQVTYDADQRNYSTEAVNADDTFQLDVVTPTTIPDNTTTLTWGTTPATP